MIDIILGIVLLAVANGLIGAGAAWVFNHSERGSKERP